MAAPLADVVPGPALPRRAVLVVFSGLMLGALLASLDQTIVATALPTIVRDLGGARHLSWVVTGYLLAATVSTPLWGKLGDVLGRKTMFQTCIAIFLVGSALCGLSQSMLELILFRALQGLGGGGLMVLAQAIIGDIVSPRERGRYQGIFGAVFGVSSVAGPLLGGFFVDNLSWRWVFYVNLPIGLVALVVTSVVLPASVRRAEVHIDYRGIALLSLGVTGLVLLTSFGGSEFGWLSWPAAILLLLSLAALVGFVRTERTAPDPVLPLRLFANPVFLNGAAIAFVVGFAMLGCLTFLPTYLQVVLHQSPTLSGLRMVPMMVGLLFTSTLSGLLITRHGRYKIYPVIGTAVFTLGLALFSRMGADTPLLVVSLFMLVFGLGLGMVMQVLTIAVQNDVPYGDLGTATSGVSFFRSIGGSFGVALFGALYASRLTSGLATKPVTTAYVDALQVVFLSAVPVGVVAFVLALTMKEKPLRTGAAQTDPADTLGIVRVCSSREEMSRALSNVLRKEDVEQIYRALAARAELELTPDAAWMLARIERRVAVRAPGMAAPTRDKLPPRFGPLLDELAEEGFIAAEGPLEVTDAGREAMSRLVRAREQSLRELLVDWEPEEHATLADLINELAGELLGDESERRIATVRAGAA